MNFQLGDNECGNVKIYGLLGVFVSFGFTVYLYGLSVNVFCIIINMLLGYFFGYIIFMSNEIIYKLLKRLFLQFKNDFVAGLVVFFLNSFFMSLILIKLLGLVLNYINFDFYSFYTVNHSIKSSLGISFIGMPIYLVIIIHKKKLDLEKKNKRLLLQNEQNKMAGELHDSLGHILITVIMQIELGSKLIEKGNYDLALSKLQLAKDQVKSGLDDIRNIVKILKKDKAELDLMSAIKRLIENIEESTVVNINYKIEEIVGLNFFQEDIIYKALQEGLTNGIKHGQATFFQFELSIEEGNLKFVLEDNGQGCKDVIKGFGLKTMEDRVISQNGNLKIATKYGVGFKLELELPIEEEN